MIDLETLLRNPAPRVQPPVLPDGDVSYSLEESPVGRLVLAATGAALILCSYDDEDAVAERLARTISPRVLRSSRRLDGPRRELALYFGGGLRTFTTPLALDLASPFASEVLRAAATVPYGGTTTYAELAGVVGRPRAARAVGSALGANPLCIFVPCHRIVRSDGSEGGYAGGPEAKRLLLEFEGARTPGPFRAKGHVWTAPTR